MFEQVFTPNLTLTNFYHCVNDDNGVKIAEKPRQLASDLQNVFVPPSTGLY